MIADMITTKKVILTQYMFSQGGIDRVCVYLATGIAAQGFNTEIVVFGRGGPAEGALTALLGEDVKVTYLGRRGAFRTWDLIRNLPVFVRHLGAAKPDCLIASANCMAWITALGLWLSALSACRLVIKTTNPIVRARGRGNALMRALRWYGYDRTFAASDAVWTLSQAETRTLAGHFPRRTHRFRTVINPYVTPAMAMNAFEKAPPPDSPRDAVKKVVAIGRLAPQKRLGELLRAFALIDPSEAHLTLVGDGEERDALKALIHGLRIEDRVTLVGFIDDVLPYLARADLMVLPSIYEGLPAAVLEAMAVNCPVLATDCFPAAREMLEAAEGCGIIEDLNPRSLAQNIRTRLAQPKPTTLSEAAATYSIENGVANHLSALIDIFQAAPRSPSPDSHHDDAVVAGDIQIKARTDVPSTMGG